MTTVLWSKLNNVVVTRIKARDTSVVWTLVFERANNGCIAKVHSSWLQKDRLRQFQVRCRFRRIPEISDGKLTLEPVTEAMLLGEILKPESYRMPSRKLINDLLMLCERYEKASEPERRLFSVEGSN